MPIKAALCWRSAARGVSARGRLALESKLGKEEGKGVAVSNRTMGML